jgi:hypothetical protein
LTLRPKNRPKDHNQTQTPGHHVIGEKKKEIRIEVMLFVLYEISGPAVRGQSGGTTGWAVVSGHAL